MYVGYDQVGVRAQPALWDVARKLCAPHAGTRGSHPWHPRAECGVHLCIRRGHERDAPLGTQVMDVTRGLRWPKGVFTRGLNGGMSFQSYLAPTHQGCMLRSPSPGCNRDVRLVLPDRRTIRPCPPTHTLCV